MQKLQKNINILMRIKYQKTMSSSGVFSSPLMDIIHVIK